MWLDKLCPPTLVACFMVLPPSCFTKITIVPSAVCARCSYLLGPSLLKFVCLVGSVGLSSKEFEGDCFCWTARVDDYLTVSHSYMVCSRRTSIEADSPPGFPVKFLLAVVALYSMFPYISAWGKCFSKGVHVLQKCRQAGLLLLYAPVQDCSGMYLSVIGITKSRCWC
jgi:hypothetical protein